MPPDFMASAPTLVLPRRRVMALWAGLAMGMVVCSYVFIICLAAACVYGPYLLVIAAPNLNTVVLLLFGVVMGAAMLWSLVPRRDKFEPPGPLLERAAHPRLFMELDALALALKEDPPAEVYIVPQANAFVIDRGGILGYGSRRVMGLGLPLLGVLTVSEFRAVLAHEFAHYYGGDTRLGPWVYKTRMAMVRAMENLASMGQYVRWALAKVAYMIIMWVLEAYWKLFFWCTQLVSRRQEYRADELAGYIAGPAALSEGLKKVNAAGAAFPAFWNSEIAPALVEGLRLPICEGFSQFVTSPGVSKNIEEFLVKLIAESKVEAYDSHPPLKDRLSALATAPVRAAEAQDQRLAASLFDRLEDEENRILAMAVDGINPAALRLVAWQDRAAAMTLSWMDQVRRHAAILGDANPESLPQALQNVAAMGAGMPDPPGTLLTHEQRAGRAVNLLAVCLALSFFKAGWELRVKPGENHFQSGNQRVSINEIMLELVHKKITPQDWTARCREMRLPNQRFVDLVAQG